MNTQRGSKRHTRRIFFLRSKSTRKQISRRTVSRGKEETCVIHDSITDLRVVPETSLIVTWIKHQHICESHRNSKFPSGGTITKDRCLIHIRDAAHSKSYWWRVFNEFYATCALRYVPHGENCHSISPILYFSSEIVFPGYFPVAAWILGPFCGHNWVWGPAKQIRMGRDRET